METAAVRAACQASMLDFSPRWVPSLGTGSLLGKWIWPLQIIVRPVRTYYSASCIRGCGGLSGCRRCILQRGSEIGRKSWRRHIEELWPSKLMCEATAAVRRRLHAVRLRGRLVR